MYRITHNEAMSFFRNKHARPQVILNEEGEGLISELADEDSDASTLAELRPLARRALEGLRHTLAAVSRRAHATFFRESLVYRDV